MVSPANVKHNKGWFIVNGRDGDRTLDQQLKGLEPLFAEVPGKTVIDAGCAEGLISMELAKAGATTCYGIEVVPGHVEMAEELAGELPCRFIVADLNTYNVAVLPQADVVLMLAILHKLRDPSRVCLALAKLARELAVVRLPPSGPTIVDARSQHVPHDIVAVMSNAGMGLDEITEGPFGEWTGYFRRQAKKVAAPIAQPQVGHFQNLPKANPAVPGMISTTSATVDTSTETKQVESETNTAKPETPADPPTPPNPADEVKVDAADAPAKEEGGKTLFPGIGRRGRRNEGKVQADEPHTDEPK